MLSCSNLVLSLLHMINYQKSIIPLIINIGIRDSKFFTVDDLMLQNVNL